MSACYPAIQPLMEGTFNRDKNLCDKIDDLHQLSVTNLYAMTHRLDATLRPKFLMEET